MFVHMNIKPMDGVDMSEEHQDLFLVLDAAKDGERGGAADSVDKGERRLELDAADMQRQVGDHRNLSSKGASQGMGLGKRSEDYKDRRRQECHQDKATDELALAHTVGGGGGVGERCGGVSERDRWGGRSGGCTEIK